MAMVRIFVVVYATFNVNRTTDSGTGSLCNRKAVLICDAPSIKRLAPILYRSSEFWKKAQYMTRKKIPINNAVIQWPRTALFCTTTQRVLVIYNRHFGTTCRSDPQGSRLFFNSWTLKMGPIGCPETSVRNYHHSLRNNSEECVPQLLRGRGLKLFKGTLRLYGMKR